MVTVRSATWELEGVEAVLFDKDGTLIDSHRYWGRIIERRARAIIDAYRLDHALFGRLCLVMGWQLDLQRLREEGPIALLSRQEVIAVVQRFLTSAGASSQLEELSALFFREHEAFKAELLDYVQMLPSVEGLLRRLRELAVKTAVVTSDTVENTREALGHLGIASYVDAVIGIDSTPEPKTSGVPAQKALELLGVPAELTVTVGDAPMDVIMAERAGLQACIGVASGQIGLATLRKHTPYVVVDLGELSIL